MDDLFKRTMTDIKMYSKVLEALAARAVELGLDPKDVTVQRAHLKVDAAVTKLLKLEATAKQLGYDSAPNALKALKMMTDKTTVTNLNQLPEVFHTVPRVWLFGKVDTKRRPGFKPLSRPVAERKHRVITPLLIEAWQLSAGDESIQDSIVREYLTVSADEFEKALYCYIHDLEEVTLEEELDNILPITDADIAESLRLATDPNRIYGVVKKEELL